MNPWVHEEGWIDPPGATWIESGSAWNFVLYARNATRVVLLLYTADDCTNPVFELELDPLRNRTGPLWHCRLRDELAADAAYYAYRVDGPRESADDFHRFDPDKILLDPYARGVHFPPDFDRKAAIGPGRNDGRAPLGVLDPSAPSDGADRQTARHGADLVIYEMHVRGFTRDSSSGVPDDRRGTFAGVVEKIPYLKDLGITAVELMPVFQFDPQEDNYWGYMPLNFMSPHAAYGMDDHHDGQRREFQEMVQALHAAGIEVLLDVVYNHTCEGDDTYPSYSYRGIDNSSYYIRGTEPDQPYADLTGCLNTLDASSLAVRKLVSDSLRYWREEMHVDGFRFDLASIFARRSDGTLDEGHPPIFGQITALRGFLEARLIGEPWDAEGADLMGRSFPGRLWMQWNGPYRDAVQRFLAGKTGMVPELMTRLYGSADHFPDELPECCRPWQSVNYFLSHDGSTLHDLVTYEVKRNEANGHGNADGAREFKWNCGHEGNDDVPAEVARLRRRQSRNAFCLLLLAAGTPMFRMGDEFLQTQGGNTNPYNQDNETSWLDWRRLETNRDFFRFVRGLIAFRAAHPSIGRSHFWRDDVTWHGTGAAIDLSDASRHLAYHLRGASVNDADVYVMINGDDVELEFTVQAPGPWRRVIDTFRDAPDDIAAPGDETPITGRTCTVAARSIVVLIGDEACDG